MVNYKEIGVKDFLSHLPDSEEQLEFVGRFLKLSSKSHLIDDVRVKYGNVADSRRRKILYLDVPNKVHLEVTLKEAFKGEEDYKIMQKLEDELRKGDIYNFELFSYCNKSYGINIDDINLTMHFGFFKILF